MTTGTKPNTDGKVHEPKFSKVPPDLTHDLRITDGAVRLYSHMYWQFWSNNDGNYEGQESMGTAMGVSEVTIANRIGELEYHGWIVVVELERSKESGNYLTPFYHVFVELKDSEVFRKTYKCQEGESIRPKPTTAREKKSRKGKGGKPANILKYNEGKSQTNLGSYSHTNSSWDGLTNSGLSGGTNSSKDGHTNSGWEELDSPELDSNSQDLNTNTPQPPMPASSDASSPLPSRNETDIDDFLKELTGSETPVDETLEEKTPPVAIATTQPPPSSAAPPPDVFDMTRLFDALASSGFDFKRPSQLDLKSYKGEKKRIQTLVDITVDTYPELSDSEQAIEVGEFYKDWGTKRGKDGKPLNKPINAESFGPQLRKWASRTSYKPQQTNSWQTYQQSQEQPDDDGPTEPVLNPNYFRELHNVNPAK